MCSSGSNGQEWTCFSHCLPFRRLFDMFSMLCFAFLCLCLSASILAVPCTSVNLTSPPSAQLNKIATVLGNVSAHVVDGVIRITLPYALPPIGPLRFADPQPAMHLPSGFNVFNTPPSCYQGTGSLLGGNPVSEDCLYST